ncbi:MAG: carboxypeptidase regulatory-like domain-containing protein, partial [Planctomycetota bacterium]
MDRKAVVFGVALAALVGAALVAWQLAPDARAGVADEPAPDAAKLGDAPATGEGSGTPAAQRIPTGTRVPVTREKGWWLSGQVKDQDSRPVARAEVSVWISRGDVREPIADLRADEVGRYEADVTAVKKLSALQRRFASLRAGAHADGFLPGKSRHLEPLPAEDLATWEGELDLRLEAGKTLRGRVLTEAGAPVSGASVRCLPRAAGGSRSSAKTGKDGLYELGIREAGEFWLVARSARHGIAFSPTIRLDPSQDSEAPDLRLREEGVIEGKALYADGTTVPDLVLGYWWSEPLAPDPLGAEREWPAELVEGSSRGHSFRTDEHGCFRIAGLRPGIYRITVQSRKYERAYHFATGTRDARIVVDLHRLRVRVMDARGGPLCNSSLAWRSWSPANAQEPEQRFLNREFLGELLETKDVIGAGNTRGPRAEKEFLAAPGSFWLFHASIDGCATAMAGVRVRSVPGVHESADFAGGRSRPKIGPYVYRTETGWMG